MEATLSIQKKSAFEQILETVLQLPGVKVNRQSFLAQIFEKFPPAQYTQILDVGPVAAGCSREELHKIAAALVTKRTMQSTAVSFAAGLPGGLTMAATIPADTLQFFGVALRLAQELGYLYGAEDLYRDGKLDDERVQGQLILYFGTMFGVSGSAAAVKVLSSAVAQQVAKKLPQKALTKTIYYPIIKKVAALLGVKVTKDTFAKGISKAIPLVGGVVSGGLTLVTMRPMGKRLFTTLEEANFDYTSAQAERDIETLLNMDADASKTEAESPLEPAFASSAPETASHFPQHSVADELLKYKSLLDAELLTHEEFNQIKQSLLGS